MSSKRAAAGLTRRAGALAAAGRQFGRLPGILPLVLLLAACAGDVPTPGQLRGALLPEPLPRPRFTMPDVSGEPFDFAARTAGKLTFLFFGYTYCPDVCPVNMSTLAAALHGLSYEDRARVMVVFVTVDPERDTPERLDEWLSAFDPEFVGLRGTVEQANAAAAQLNLPPAVRQPGDSADYTVGHAATVVAFSPDGPARVVYPFGTRREDWVHDLPALLGHEPMPNASGLLARGGEAAIGGARSGGGAPGQGGQAASSGASAGAGERFRTPVGVAVVRAFVTRSRMAESAALYAILENGTSSPDALVSVAAPAGRTELHETVREGEGSAMRMQMRPVSQVSLPAGATVRLAPGGYHVMLLQPALPWEPGDTVTAIFRFASGEQRTVQAPVVPPEDVARLLDEQAGG